MTFFDNLRKSLIDSFPKALRQACWLLKIMIPVSITVNILQWTGVISHVAAVLEPVMQMAGLPGHSAVVFLTGAFVTTYAGVAALMAMEFTLRQATIVSIMILLCHALPLESTVIRKTGSSFWKMSVLRLVMAIVAAFFLNAVLPGMPQQFSTGVVAGQASLTWSSFVEMMVPCLLSLVRLCLVVTAIIYGLMALQDLIGRYGLMDRMTRPLRPLMRVFGLPEGGTYMWIVGNVLGISYGSAVMLELEETGQITRHEADEMNYHLVMSHSLVEDTLVFASFGVPAFWIVFTRLLFAMAVVWGRKMIKALILNIKP